MRDPNHQEGENKSLELTDNMQNTTHTENSQNEAIILPEETTDTQPLTVTNSNGILLRVYLDEKVGSRIKRFLIGKKPAIFAEEKVLMLVGVSPDAKRNAIHGIFNYILLGPVTMQNVRTNEITAYTIYPQKDSLCDYILTIINMPSFEGLEESQITVCIKQVLEIQPFESGLDAIGYVVESSLTRRSNTMETHKAIHRSILKIFNTNIEIIPLIFDLSDEFMPKKRPIDAIDAISDIGIKSADSPPFNYTKHATQEQKIAGNHDNWFKFFMKFNLAEVQSLQLPKYKLLECQRLQTTIKGLQPQISQILIKIEEIYIEREQIVAHQDDIKSNRRIYLSDECPSYNKKNKEVSSWPTCNQLHSMQALLS